MSRPCRIVAWGERWWRELLSPSRIWITWTPLDEKVIGKKEAMASLRCGLGTHATGATHSGQAEQLLHCRDELRGIHVIGVVAKGTASESLVGDWGSSPVRLRPPRCGSHVYETPARPTDSRSDS
jgi:hypothetical protein